MAQPTASSSSNINVFTVSMNHITYDMGKDTLIDTGASRCGTPDASKLSNKKPCDHISVQGAFGPPVIPRTIGTITDMDLECVLLPSLSNTLISVSQACAGGRSGNEQVFIFTKEGCRAYSYDSVSSAIQSMSLTGVETLRAENRNGLYVMTPPSEPTRLLAVQVQDTPPTPPTPPTPRAMTQDTLLYKDAVPLSIYDRVHMSCNHPGLEGMLWHRNNTVGAAYQSEDAAQARRLRKGCIEGGMRQTGTDHRRDHRLPPNHPGSQFAMDAFACKYTSATGNRYCDILTDLYSRVSYCVLTKNRSAEELVDKLSIFFDGHPEWRHSGSPDDRIFTYDNAEDKTMPADDRLIRLDAESSYKSTEFLAMAYKYNYRLEHTPPRDKHAGGIAERSIGVIALKTNVAMMAPSPPVPKSYWDLAMVYACQTQSFNYSSVIRTSPYHLLTGRNIILKHLHPFWASCYVYIPLKNEWAK